MFGKIPWPFMIVVIYTAVCYSMKLDKVGGMCVCVFVCVCVCLCVFEKD